MANEVNFSAARSAIQEKAGNTVKKSVTQGNAMKAVNNANNDITDKINQVRKQVQDAESEVFGYIDSAMARLEKLPKFTDDIMGFVSSNSFQFTRSPMYLLLYLLTHEFGVKGNDIKKWLVDFLIDALPEIEIGVKTALLANIKELVSCADDPRIPKQMRKRTGYSFPSAIKYKIKSATDKPTNEDERGMLIDVDSIDPDGMLAYSPYSDQGQDFYFGIRQDEMERFYNSIGAQTGDRNLNTGNTSTVQSSTISKWELLRADDKNAFLWFVMHVARFPAPKSVSVNGDTITLGQNKYINYNADENSQPSLFKPMLWEIGSDSGSSTIAAGDAIKFSGQTNAIGLCTNAIIDEGDPNSIDPARVRWNRILPLASDPYSVDWYTDRSKYYSDYLGYTKDNETGSDLTSNQSAICNIQFLRPEDYETSYITGNTQKFRFTILPKPYVYVPYVNDGEKLTRFTRILFDAYGNPDPKGNFSLPTEKTTSSGTPYVHNDSVSLLSNPIINAINSSSFDKDFQTVLLSIYKEEWTDDKTQKTEHGIDKVRDGIVQKYNSSEIQAMILCLENWQPENNELSVTSHDMKSKSLSYLRVWLQDRISKEAASADASDNEVVMTVGEISDNCKLHINKQTGQYYLKAKDQNSITKHLVQCYKGLTVYEFNYDFVMGMRLFSPKVVCAKLMRAATNGMDSSTFSIGINKSVDKSKYSYSGNEQRIVDIVRKIIETDDAELSDCFFTFSNDEINDMLNASENKRNHLQPYLNTDGKPIDLSDVYQMMMNYPESGTKEEQKTYLTNVLDAATAKINNSVGINKTLANSDSKNVSYSFATNMLSNLAATLVSTLLSPKVLLLIAVNKQLMGSGGETFNTKALLQGMKGLIIAIVKEIRDLVLQKLMDWVMDQLAPILAEIQAEVVKEQFSTYRLILADLLNLLQTGKEYTNRLNSVLQALLSKFGDKNNGKGRDYDLPTVLDNVNYADIISTGSTSNDTPVTENC